MLHNIGAYLALEQNDSWHLFQQAVLSQCRDLFSMRAAWRRRDPIMLEHGLAMAMSSMNVAALGSYQHSMTDRVVDVLLRYGRSV